MAKGTQYENFSSVEDSSKFGEGYFLLFPWRRWKT